MSIENINAGLTRRAQKGVTSLSGVPATIPDLSKLAESATAKRDRLAELSNAALAAVSKYEKEAESKWRDAGKHIGDNGQLVDTLGAARRAKMLAQDVATYRKGALKTSADERLRLRSELAAINQQISAAQSLWATPEALLIRSTVGKRGSYPADVAHSGPAEIDNLLHHAALTGDKALAGALFARIDALPSDARKMVRVCKREIAESLVGQEWHKAQTYIATAELAGLEGELADAECEGKSASSQMKITLGARKRDLAALLNPDAGKVETGDTDDKETPEPSVFKGVKGSGANPEGGHWIGG